MKTGRIVAILSVVSLALAFGSAHASAGSGTKTYVAGSAGDATVGFPKCDAGPQATNVGGACFKEVSGTHLRVTVSDTAAKDPGFWLLFKNIDGTCVGQQDATAPCPGLMFAGCGSASVAIPATTWEIDFIPDGPLFGPIDCPSSATKGIATNGSVTFTIT